MTLALEAPRPLLALETKATADARRARAAWTSIGRGIAEAFSRIADAFRPLVEAAARALVDLVDLVSVGTPTGYYWRDGKLRRDHSYFRQRARDRRAAKRLAKA